MENSQETPEEPEEISEKPEEKNSKPKKPRSEKQLAVLAEARKKALETIKKNAEMRKQKKDSIEEVESNHITNDEVITQEDEVITQVTKEDVVKIIEEKIPQQKPKKKYKFINGMYVKINVD